MKTGSIAAEYEKNHISVVIATIILLSPHITWKKDLSICRGRTKNWAASSEVDGYRIEWIWACRHRRVYRCGINGRKNPCEFTCVKLKLNCNLKGYIEQKFSWLTMLADVAMWRQRVWIFLKNAIKRILSIKTSLFIQAIERKSSEKFHTLIYCCCCCFRK